MSLRDDLATARRPLELMVGVLNDEACQDALAALGRIEAHVQELGRELDAARRDHKFAAHEVERLYQERYNDREAAEVALADMRRALARYTDAAAVETTLTSETWLFPRGTMAKLRALAAADSGTVERYKPGDKLPTGETFIGYTEDDTPIWSEPVTKEKL